MDPEDNNQIYICTKHVTITGAASTIGFNYNGVTDLGTYRYSFTSASLDSSQGSAGTVITIV